MNLRKNIFYILLYGAGIATAFLLQSFGVSPAPADIYNDTTTFRDEGEYSYVSPLLMCGISENTESTTYEELKTQIINALSATTEEGDLVSIYFRNLKSGDWFSINRDERYAPASLLKLPLFIAYLKEAENAPHLLETTITLDPTIDYNEGQNFPSASKLRPGQAYTIRKLLEAMIQYSDNNATVALVNNISNDLKAEIFTDLGVTLPSRDPDEEFMTVKQYAGFFRVLYNGSYLTHKDSEYALKTLLASRFPQGISSALPPDVEIAEKFGERAFKQASTEQIQYELHDCGIVYYPEQPYLLCIMTKSAQNFEHLSGIIRTISGSIFKSFSKE